MSNKKRDMVRQGIVDTLLKYEKNYLLSKRDLEKNYKSLKEYSNSLKQTIIDRMIVSDLKEITYHRLVEKPLLAEIPISELEKVLTQNIIKHIMVTVDLEATKERLKVELGLTDIVIEPIIEAIKRVETIKVLDLEEKEQK